MSKKNDKQFIRTQTKKREGKKTERLQKEKQPLAHKETIAFLDVYESAATEGRNQIERKEDRWNHAAK